MLSLALETTDLSRKAGEGFLLPFILPQMQRGPVTPTAFICSLLDKGNAFQKKFTVELQGKVGHKTNGGDNELK